MGGGGGGEAQERLKSDDEVEIRGEMMGYYCKCKCKNKMTKMTVEELVEAGYVGSFGFSQLLHVFFVSLAWIFDSQNTFVTIFTDAQPSSSSSSASGSSSSSSSWVNGHRSSTTIAEWNLVRDRKFLAAIPASLFFLGSLLGSGVYGRMADSQWGRKKTVLVSCLLTSITAFLTSFSPNLPIYSLLRFSNGFARSGIGICSLVLSSEAPVGRKWRGHLAQYGFFFFTAGFLSLSFIAYLTRTCWRSLYRIISLLPLLYSLFILLPFVEESPRWLLLRGRSNEALHVLKRFAKLNGKKLPPNICLKEPVEEDNNMGTSLWTTKWAAKRIITVMVAGFGVGFVYYGVQLNVENLNFNLYFSVALNAMMEIPAVFIGSLLLSFTNRRLLFSWSAYIAGVSCILCAIFSLSLSLSSSSWPQLAIEAIGFMAASTAFDVLYIYCVELFPTNVRNFALSLLRQALMLGASLAPLLVVLGRLTPSLSVLALGALSIFSGTFSLCLPETRNAPLYDTLDQQSHEHYDDDETHQQEVKLTCISQA